MFFFFMLEGSRTVIIAERFFFSFRDCRRVLRQFSWTSACRSFNWVTTDVKSTQKQLHNALIWHLSTEPKYKQTAI